MSKTLALSAVALTLALWAATPVHAQSMSDTSQQKGDQSMNKDPSAPARATQTTRAARTRTNVDSRDTIGNQPPAERAEAGAGGR